MRIRGEKGDKCENKRSKSALFMWPKEFLYMYLLNISAYLVYAFSQIYEYDMAMANYVTGLNQNDLFILSFRDIAKHSPVCSSN